MIRVALLALLLTFLPGTFLWLVVVTSMTGSCALVRGAAIVLEARARPLAA